MGNMSDIFFHIIYYVTHFLAWLVVAFGLQRARGLLTKGKNGTNNCFVTIALGKEKYQTSVKDKAETSVNWNEECELKIPDQGNRAELTLTCLHRNNLGIDEFLGQASLPLNEMDVYDRPRAKWFKLESKPGKEKKNKERGELEVRIAFVVKSGSLTDLSKKDKHKSSIGQLASSVGGSLLSIGNGEKRRSIKKLAGSLSSKLHIRSKKKQEAGGGADDSSSFGGSFASLGTPNSSTGRGQNGGSGRRRGGQRAGEADPGVISEDEDEFVFDNLSHKSSGSSLNIQRTGLQPPPSAGAPNFAPRHPSPLLSNGVALGVAGNGSGSGSGKDKYNNDNESSSPSPKSTERIIIGHEKSGSHAERRSEISAQLAKKYEGKSREELMLIANGMENEALLQRQRVKELEDYLDNLLLRVMETHPKILQNPYSRTTSAKRYGTWSFWSHPRTTRTH
ncbi:rab11 family-interacting protein 1 isoform X6 [Drosophila gunungcola]|uniref:rab11 family-interacting protein 1 isoform X6 n=1 Tax=Drosophila gunungcola TaxID=103775 RepID=UPI0022E5A017|nr:rab11 family-interacting protein 1 isoform X6 [Drosophila gunungcola]